MPLRFDSAALRRLSRTIEGLVKSGTPQRKRMVGAIVNATKALTREQFAKGIDPAGAPQAPRKKDGKPGMKSEKLARGAVAIVAEGDVIRGRSKNPKWAAKLEAHQEGHTFAKTRQFRNAKGKLIKQSTYVRATRKEGVQSAYVADGESFASKIKKNGERSLIASKSTAGPRVLVPRPIYPAGGSQLTARWENRIGEFVSKSIVATLAPVKK